AWSDAGVTASVHWQTTATLLASGKVLIVAGYDRSQGASIAAVEIYDPQANAWTAAASLPAPSAIHAAALLGDGTVLVAGGRAGNGANVPYVYYGTAERYDPASDSWSPAGTLDAPRGYHAMTVLPSGEVLLVGGVNDQAELATAQRYSLAANAW